MPLPVIDLYNTIFPKTKKARRAELLKLCGHTPAAVTIDCHNVDSFLFVVAKRTFREIVAKEDPLPGDLAGDLSINSDDPLI